MANPLEMLIAERDRLNRAIDILQSGEGTGDGGPEPKRRGRKPGSKNAPKKRKRNMTPEARKAVSDRMKKYWAARRKAKK